MRPEASDLCAGVSAVVRGMNPFLALRALLLGLSIMLTGGLSGAQATDRVPEGALPGWLVPVLQRVDEGRVIAGSGVVVASERVLVPSEFVASGHPLVVLDGGGNLANNGRAATVLERWPREGLAVLSVPGLDRAPPVLADVIGAGGAVSATQATGSAAMETEAGDRAWEIALVAIAPAEQLLAGTPWVWRRASAVAGAQGELQLAPGVRLPNLTGVFIDACGHWLGHSAARGVASLGTGLNTLYQWQPALAGRLVRGGYALTEAPCDRDFDALTPKPLTDNPGSTPISSAPSSPDHSSDPSSDLSSDPSSNTPPANDSLADPTSEGLSDEAAALPSPPGTPVPREESSSPVSLELDMPEVHPAPGLVMPEPEKGTSFGGPPLAFALLAGLMMMVFLAVAGLFVVRRRRQEGREGTTVPSASSSLMTVAWLVAPKERHPVIAIDGVVDRIIGRFEADLLLSGESVSRRHARLRGVPGSVQLFDLGSKNGTFINDRPCAPNAGEQVQAGDRLRFGAREFEWVVAGDGQP